MVAIINYAVLSSHRSGSSLLCQLLSQTGIAGTPGEFFLHWEGRSYGGMDIADYPAYMKTFIADTKTANDVFGVKAMSTDFADACARLEAFPEYKGHSMAEKIRTFFPNIKFIYLTRRNKVAQAISWAKAAQNDHYHSTPDHLMPDDPVQYDSDMIANLLNQLVMEECAHQALLSEMQAVPLTIVYEDYIQNMAGTVAQIIDFLKIEEDYTYQPPTLIRTANAQSEQWVQRYREELQSDWQFKRW